MSSTRALESFFRPHAVYVVTGASTDPSKFGYRILGWYAQRSLPVVPVNPKSPVIFGLPSLKTVEQVYSETWAEGAAAHGHLNPTYIKDDNSSADDSSSLPPPLKSAKEYVDSISISFVTPPKVSIGIVDSIASNPDLKSLVKAVWFQEGSFDDSVLEAAKNAGIETIIAHGKCILIEGQRSLNSSQKSWKL